MAVDWKHSELKFEIQSVIHLPNEISFDWDDVGGTYMVYRDGELLYEGTVASFSDGDLKHAKMYTYHLERIENGEVVDVIALQTSAFAEEKNRKNPLESIVLTTIIAKTQIALSWEKIPGVSEYEVFRDKEFVKKTQATQFIERNFSLEEPVTYWIRCKRPLSKSAETLSGSRSFIAKLFDKGRSPSEEQASVEEFGMTKLIAKPKDILKPLNQTSPHVNQWNFRYTTFLEEERIPHPNLFSPIHSFKGDGRGFNPTGESFRTRVDIELDYGKTGVPLKLTKSIGQTVAYNVFNEVRDSAYASDEGIELERTSHGQDEVGFLLQHAVGNPLVAAPEINYEVKAVMRRNGVFDITGTHDPAPHHEVYLSLGNEGEWQPIHLTESKGLAWMSGVIAWQYWRCSNFISLSKTF